MILNATAGVGMERFSGIRLRCAMGDMVDMVDMGDMGDT
jgi:hypothetical protein